MVRKTFFILALLFAQLAFGQLSWHQPQAKVPMKKDTIVDGVTYTIKSKHPKELEMMLAVNKLKKGEELSQEQILCIYDIVLARTNEVLGTRVFVGRSNACADYVEYIYEGLYPTYSVSQVSNPIGIFGIGSDDYVPPRTCDPLPGMPVYWHGIEFSHTTYVKPGHVGIFHSMKDLGNGWHLLRYYDQNNYEPDGSRRRYVGIDEILVVKGEFCTFSKVYPYFQPTSLSQRTHE